MSLATGFPSIIILLDRAKIVSNKKAGAETLLDKAKEKILESGIKQNSDNLTKVLEEIHLFEKENRVEEMRSLFKKEL